jgi:hypothetical protein
MLSPRCIELQEHYKTTLSSEPKRCVFDRGPVQQLPADFCVFEMPPCEKRDLWLYATCGLSFSDANPIETYIFSPRQASELVELLYFVSYFHFYREELDAGHTVNFGRPWLLGSACEYGLFLVNDGAKVEWATIDSRKVHFLWLVPITEKERDHKVVSGIDALGKSFTEGDVDPTDIFRASSI